MVVLLILNLSNTWNLGIALLSKSAFAIRSHLHAGHIVLLLVVQWPSAVLGQHFRGHIYCAALCELVLCQSNAPEVIYIVLCSVVP